MDAVAIDQYVEEVVHGNNCYRDNTSPLENWKSIPDSVVDSDESTSGGFDCNICLDSVQDPVVTLCGHLYCWPCIYKWIHFQGISTEHKALQPQQQCPVCKAEVSESTLVPLFGRDQTAKPCNLKPHSWGIIIPRRPLGIASGFDSPRQTQLVHNRSHPRQPQPQLSRPGSHSGPPISSPRVTAGNMFDPDIGVFGEMIYERVFGNSVTNIYSYRNSYNLAGITSPRLRRHVLEVDKCLSRISFFLFCCVLLCFLSF